MAGIFAKVFHLTTLHCFIRERLSELLVPFGQNICYYAIAALDHVNMLPSNMAAIEDNLLYPVQAISIGRIIEQCGAFIFCIDTALYTPEWRYFLKTWLMRIHVKVFIKCTEYRQNQQLQRYEAEMNLKQALKFVVFITEHRLFTMITLSLTMMYRYIVSLLAVIGVVFYVTISKVAETIVILLIRGYDERHSRTQG